MDSKRQQPKPNETPEASSPVAGTWMDIAAKQAGRDAVRHHHREGRSVPILHDGRVMYLNPDGSITTSDLTPQWANAPSPHASA